MAGEDIKDQILFKLGQMGQQIKDLADDVRASRDDHRTAVRKLERVEGRTEAIERTLAVDVKPACDEIAKVKLHLEESVDPKVFELMQFKGRVGAIIGVASMVITSAIYLIWQGISYFSNELRAAVSRLFH